jgi:hypothetical protein
MGGVSFTLRPLYFHGKGFWCSFTRKLGKFIVSVQSKRAIQLTSNHFTDVAIATHIKKSQVRFLLQDVYCVPTGMRNCGSRPLKTVRWKKGSQGGQKQCDSPNDARTPICENQGGDVLEHYPRGAHFDSCVSDIQSLNAQARFTAPRIG